jgi:thiol:disulfide interchange protein DsbC
MRGHRIIFMVISFVIFFSAAPSFSSDACSDIDLPFISQIVNGDQTNTIFPSLFSSETSIVSKKPINDLKMCEIILKMQQDGQYVSCYVGSDYVLLGRVFKDGQSLSDITISELKKAAFASVKPKLDDLAAFTYTPKGKSVGTIYMITDPLCPYCHRAEAGIMNLASEFNVKLKVLLYGVHGVNGDKRAAQALCKGLTLEDYIKGDWQKENIDEAQCEKGKVLVEKTKAVVSQLGLGGVPMFYLNNGASVTGANMPALKEILTKLQTNK